MGTNMKRGTKAFETVLVAVATVTGLALMMHHYTTFN